MGRQIKSYQIVDEIVSGYIQSGVIHLVKDDGTEIIISGTIEGPDGVIDLSSLSQDIIPSEGNKYNLGSPDKPFKEIYVSENTLNIGDTPLSVKGGKLTVGDSNVITISPNNSVIQEVTSITQHIDLSYNIDDTVSASLQNRISTSVSSNDKDSIYNSLLDYSSIMDSITTSSGDFITPQVDEVMDLATRVSIGYVSLDINLPEIDSLSQRVSTGEVSTSSLESRVSYESSSLSERVSTEEFLRESSDYSVIDTIDLAIESLDTRISDRDVAVDSLDMRIGIVGASRESIENSIVDSINSSSQSLSQRLSNEEFLRESSDYSVNEFVDLVSQSLSQRVSNEEYSRVSAMSSIMESQMSMMASLNQRLDSM